MKVWKLVSGILSIILFAFVIFQSCAAGVSNALEENGEASGTAGAIVAIMLLTGGIVSIVTRKSKKKGGSIALIILFGLGAIIGFTCHGSYSDLEIWSGWCLINAVLAVIDIITRKKYSNKDIDEEADEETEQKKGKKWIVVIVCVIIFMVLALGIGFSDSGDTSSTSESTETTDTDGTGESSSDETERLQVGDTYEGDGLKFTINSSDMNYQPQNNEYGFYDLDAGYKYVAVAFTFENTGSSDAYVSIYDFDCYADNTSCEQKYLSDGGDFMSANLSAGRNVSFTTYYAVPENAAEIELEYTSNIWTSEKVVVQLQ